MLNVVISCFCKQCRSRSAGLEKPADLDPQCFALCLRMMLITGQLFLTYCATLAAWSPDTWIDFQTMFDSQHHTESQ